MATPQEIARDISLRARAGDQNAMALIAETKRSAEQGSPVAKKQLECIIEFCRTKPVKNKYDAATDATRTWSDKPPMRFAGEDSHLLGQLKTASCGFVDPSYRPRLILARGKIVTSDDVKQVYAEVAPQVRASFKRAIVGQPLPNTCRPLPAPLTDAYFIGHVVKRAKDIQTVARDASTENLAKLCPRVAAEMT
jgi:hypothetical protein